MYQKKERNINLKEKDMNPLTEKQENYRKSIFDTLQDDRQSAVKKIERYGATNHPLNYKVAAYHKQVEIIDSLLNREWGSENFSQLVNAKNNSIWWSQIPELAN